MIRSSALRLVDGGIPAGEGAGAPARRGAGGTAMTVCSNRRDIAAKAVGLKKTLVACWLLRQETVGDKNVDGPRLPLIDLGNEAASRQSYWLLEQLKLPWRELFRRSLRESSPTQPQAIPSAEAKV